MSLPLINMLYLVSATYFKDIADVSHFVHPDTAMDNEASTRERQSISSISVSTCYLHYRAQTYVP